MQWYSFYSKFFPAIKSDIKKQNVICPFHADSDPSMSIDLDSGLYYCHSCQEGGDVYKFFMKHENCSFTMAKRAINGNDQVQVLTETEVDVAHGKLLSSQELQKMLLIKRGWTLETIKKFKLGWNDSRVYIPIYEHNELKNIRKYDILHTSKEKFRGIKGYNSIRLWPSEAFDNDIIILCAGEPDTILARQLGLNAVTFTGGEGTFKESLLPLFKKKKVYILYDVDKTGKQAAHILSEKICKYAEETRIIVLPANVLPPKGDFTDLYMYCCDNDTPFINIWNPLVEGSILVTNTEEAPKDDEFERVDFYSAVKEDYYKRSIQFDGIAVGKNLSPFFVPKTVKVSCDFTRGDSCKDCKMFVSGGEQTITIDDSTSLELIHCSSSEQRNKIRGYLGISKCNQYSMETDTETIEEIFIAPTIDTERIDRQFIIRKAYAKGHNLQLNKTYKFFGKTISDAKSQEATHFFSEQRPELTALDKFKLNDQDKIDLKIFQPKELKDKVTAVYEKMFEIARDILYNIPELIVGRENLVIAYDLIFHSVLKFKFLGSSVEKGWTELLVLGDTRTGKTKTATKLCKHYRVGEYVTLESATLPGLIGGMAQFGRDVNFSWGILPINDGRIVILDEVNGLDVGGISNLSSMRDNGVAERTVVGSTRKTSSRVRMIWISNPRSMNVRVSYYSTGVEAIKELMGRAEDIARLDFAIIAAKEDVNVNSINTLHHRKPDHVYTSDLCNKVVMWAWSRKENQVTFTHEAEIAILKHAISMSDKYTDEIPLVQGSVQRIKLAKLSVAVACRLFSTEDGEKVVVREEHVDFVAAFLQEIYDGTYFGYNNFSNIRKEENTISAEDKVEKTIVEMVNPDTFINKMMSQNLILFDDISDFSGFDRDKTKEFKYLLVSSNCIKRRKQFYVKTPEFVRMLKQIQKKREKK